MGMKRVLVLQPGGIGDVVMSLPALCALKGAFPESRLDVALVQKAPQAILTEESCDRAFVVPYGLSQWWPTLKSAFDLRQERYDICFVPTGVNPWKAGLFAWLAGAKVRMGDRRGRVPALFYTHSIPLDATLHIVESNEKILSLLGVSARQKAPFLKPQPEAAKKAEKFFSAHELVARPVLGLHLGSGLSGGAKRWPAEHVERLGVLLKQHMPEARILIFGAPSETALVFGAAENIGDTAVVAVRQSLEESIALMARCAAFLGPDGGLVHLAAALGVPTVALFGPIDPQRNGPRGKSVHIIQEQCRHMRRAPENPQEGKHECMERITPERVYSFLKPLLNHD